MRRRQASALAPVLKLHRSLKNLTSVSPRLGGRHPIRRFLHHVHVTQDVIAEFAPVYEYQAVAAQVEIKIEIKVCESSLSYFLLKLSYHMRFEHWL